MPAESSDGLRPSQKQTGEKREEGRGKTDENTQSLTTQLERAVRFLGCLADALRSSADAIRGVVISPIGTRLNGAGVWERRDGCGGVAISLITF